MPKKGFKHITITKKITFLMALKINEELKKN